MSTEVLGELPLNLVLLRHGQSTHNEAMSAYVHEQQALPDWFSEEHGAFSTLTTNGILRTQRTGRYLTRRFPDGFDRYITSDLPRALQTAWYLALEGAEWEVRGLWRERELGENISQMNQGQSAESRRSRLRSPYQWTPKGGEALSVGVAARVRLEEFDLRMSPPSNNVLVVTHGDLIGAMLREIEGLTIAEWDARYLSRKRIVANNMIVHLSRLAKDGSIAPNYQRLRGICPWDGTRSWNHAKWVDIEPMRKYSNDELFALINRSLPKSALHTEVGGDF